MLAGGLTRVELTDDSDVVFTWVASVGLLEPRLDSPLRVARVQHGLLRRGTVKDRASHRPIFKHGVRQYLLLLLLITTAFILCFVLATGRISATACLRIVELELRVLK